MNSIPIDLSGSGHTRMASNRNESTHKVRKVRLKSDVPYDKMQMQLAICVSRRTPQGVSRLVHAMSAWSVITRGPGIVTMRGSMGLRLRLCKK